LIERSTLYIVSTPIGNMSDITLRALDVLKSADLVVCEDTRRTRGLMSHHRLSRPLLSFNDVNKESRTPGILAKLTSGKAVALVSDAGTPAVSDPGFYLVRAAIAQGIGVVPVPGASAILASLVVSGLATDRFLFVGFLPRKQGRRKKAIVSFATERGTIIIYETANRLQKTLPQLAEVLGPDRKLVVARELTKRFEQVVRTDLGSWEDTLSSIPLKGEFVVLVSGNTK
jgi:16S rRNA (cytidine1402-2'-O)-methyltransferase